MHPFPIPTLLALSLTVSGTAVAAAEPAPVDARGDPLPDGARFRFGSLRYRHADGINSSALSPDGRLLATAAKTNVAIWELASGRRLQIFRDCGIPDGFAGSKVAFSPDGKLLAHVCDFEVAVRVWEVATGKLVRAVGRRGPRPKQPWPPAPWAGAQGDFDPAEGLRFSAGGKELLVYGGLGSNPRAYRVAAFDPHTGARLRTPSAPYSPAAFSPDGQRFAGLVTPSQGDHFLLLCSTATGREEGRFEITFVEQTGCVPVAFAPDGKTLAVGNGGTELRVWEAATGREKQVFQLPQAREDRRPFFTALHFSPDGKVLVGGTTDLGIRRYDLAAGKELAPLAGHLWRVTGLHTTLDGKALISTSWDCTIRRWDLAAGAEIPLPAGYARAASTARSPDGKWVAVGDLAGRLDLWDAAGGKLVRSLQTSGPGIYLLAFAPDGQTLAAGRPDGGVQLWDPFTGKETGAFTPSDPATESPYFWMNALAFSPNGSRLVTSARKHGLRLWDFAARKPVWSMVLDDEITAAFSPDGKTLVTGGWKSRLSFRDAATGRERLEVSVPADPDQRGQGTYIDSIAFAPDGTLLATAHHDGLIRFWDPGSGKEVKRLRGHTEPVWAVRFSPDGKWVVSGSVDQTVRVWEVLTGKEVRKLTGQGAWVREVAFGADAKTVLAGGGTEVLLWSARPPGPAPGDLSALWEDLLSVDAAKAYTAVWALADRPREASELLRRRIAPEKVENPEQLTKLIAGLDSSQFAEREAATKTLTELGAQAEPALREALGKPSSLEAERRLRMVLDRLSREPTPEEVRRSRAVQALELAGTAEARKVLAAWAVGAPGMRLTEDARRSLDRTKTK
jgi:WD40 repeat protein